MLATIYSGYYANMASYLILILPAMIFAIWASARVNSTFNKYSKINVKRNITAAEACEKILYSANVRGIKIERISGNLNDHYDPKTETIRLSDNVYNSTSIAAIGVAAHEAGHAIQKAEEYTPMKIRAAIIPITRIGSNLAMPLIIIGFIFSAFWFLIPVGIAFFSLAAIFQLVTLPVEYDASRRALALLEGDNIMQSDELSGAKRVLSAAAMTYVAALAVSLANLLRIILLFTRRK